MLSAANDISGYQLYAILTEAVMQLEFLGLKVIALTSNGASPNHKLLQGTTPKTNKKQKKCGQPTNGKQSPNLTYKFHNPFTSEDCSVYLFSGVPHFLKTTRNCWENSHWHSGTQSLWVCQNAVAIYVGVVFMHYNDIDSCSGDPKVYWKPCTDNKIN